MLQRLLTNHVLANILFVVVMTMGVLAYLNLPREQDPTINFNWINITTVHPGASTEDVERQITNIIEDAIRAVDDIKFVSSNSREGISSLLVRFNDLDERIYDKRLADLRREIDGIKQQLPSASFDPILTEITTDNAFPTATVVITGAAYDDNLRRQANRIKLDLEQIKGVGNILDIALDDPQLQITFNPRELARYGINPQQLSDTLASYFRSFSAGSMKLPDGNWTIKVDGKNANLAELSQLSIVGKGGEVPLSSVADIAYGKEKNRQLVRFNDQPAILFAITKKGSTNIIQLVDRINSYIASANELSHGTGVTVTLVDDQTLITKDALSVMQTNALVGLAMVILVTWLFLGTQIAILAGLAIPVILAATFWVLSYTSHTLNVTVLLGVVISLGMLVDDAIVVVEAIYYRLQRGANTLQASLQGLQEVMIPVTTAVLTTMAAFLPLMLLPGILGKFMLVIPLVVTLALAISLIEAFWLLPAHIIGLNLNFSKPGRIHRLRESLQRNIRRVYCRLLIFVFRWPIIALLVLITAIGGAGLAVAKGKIKTDFFANDPIRLFYVTVQMPSGTSLNNTLSKTLEVEKTIRQFIEPGDARAITTYAGQAFTETEPLFGDQFGQVQVSLNPKTAELRDVLTVIDDLRDSVVSIPGAENISILKISGGPPTSRPISVKIRGDNFSSIRAALDELRAFMDQQSEFQDISDDDLPGQNSLAITLRDDAIQRSGIAPETIYRSLRLLVDGEVVTDFRRLGETVDVIVKRQSDELDSIDQLLDNHLVTPQGDLIQLRELVNAQKIRSANAIRHYNFRRTITIEADIDKSIIDTVGANDLIKAHWQTIRQDHPGIDLDFTGVLDDINESLSAIGVLFIFGLGLIYLILGTQFRSYFQPFLIIATVPMAFTGVIMGLLLSGDSLSLYTLYGIVALAGIAVNAAIVLISTANRYLDGHGSVVHAAIFAARRRVIPIIITTFTTIAGLFSLATGLGGKSLLWGPVASSIVWGLAVSSVLTLFLVPLLYRLFMSFSHRGK